MPELLPRLLSTTSQLVRLNIFMTFAWYAHLKNMANRTRYVAGQACCCMVGAVYFMFRGSPA
jgi:uncharacterized protein (DUF486 family)